MQRFTTPTKENFAKRILTLTDEKFEQILFIEAIGSTFTCIAIFEHTLIQALFSARGVKMDQLPDPTIDPKGHILEKLQHLKSKTLGNIIQVLVKNNADENDISYLKFLQNKRDFFIHRFFGEYPWPGDVGQYDIEIICRKLRYLELIFGRAADRVWDIIGQNGYAEIVDLGSNGRLLINHFDEESPFFG